MTFPTEAERLRARLVKAVEDAGFCIGWQTPSKVCPKCSADLRLAQYDRDHPEEGK